MASERAAAIRACIDFALHTLRERYYRNTRAGVGELAALPCMCVYSFPGKYKRGKLIMCCSPSDATFDFLGEDCGDCDVSGMEQLFF